MTRDSAPNGDQDGDQDSDQGAAGRSRRRPFRDWLLFFGLWLRRPMKIANFAPSGPALARAMVADVPADKPGRVVELGGGTGVFTEALLNAGLAPNDLIVVEREKALFDLLKKRFPGCHVVQGDAGDIQAIAQKVGGAVKAVVSGLPILTMSEELQTRILDGAFQAMGDDGVFAQFTYMGKSPVKPEVIDKLGLTVTLAAKVPNNAPPARVYTYRKPAAGKAAQKAT
jgi:phosphatidylethanolamine/phosphatidyl-N-methylethanolamine N-methyltransferase